MTKTNILQLLTVVGVFALATGVAYLYWYSTPQRLNVQPFLPKNKKAIKDATLE